MCIRDSYTVILLYYTLIAKIGDFKPYYQSEIGVWQYGELRCWHLKPAGRIANR